MTTFSIQNDQLCQDGQPVQFDRALYYGAAAYGIPGLMLKPRFIVMHYTAGSNIQSTINWFAFYKRVTNRTSAHLVIGYDGRVVQFVPFTTIAWHAGGKYQGLQNMNWFSFGIELVNVGFLRSGVTIPLERQFPAIHPKEKALRVWERYPQAQIDALIGICRILKETYGIGDLIGHEDCGGGLDPGPAFPWHQVQESVFSTEPKPEPTDSEKLNRLWDAHPELH